MGNTELLNITITSSVAGPLLAGGIVIEVLEGVDDLPLPGHPTMKAALAIDVDRILPVYRSTVKRRRSNRP